jgi:peptidoglycan/xylan/chitin deacetylase (PgdA/CDA1 family)
VLPPILCYHKVDTRFELGVTRLGPRAFRRQVTALAARGVATLGSEALALACAEAAQRASRGAAAPGSVVLTFDDGYEALDRHAFPALADHAFRALVFVVTDFVGRENRWDVRWGGRSFRHLSWDQLARWQERGVEVHAHGATHRRLTWLSDGEVADELGRAREAIRERLGSPPAAVCYPFGAADARVRALAVRAGYTLGFAGPGATGADPLLLGRLPVYAWDVFGPPLVMRNGALGRSARATARLASRFAVVTSALKQRRR